MIFFVIFTIYLKKLIDFDYSLYFRGVTLRILIVMLISSIPTILVGNFIENGFVKLIFSVIVFEVIYIPTAYYVGFNLKEKELFLSLCRTLLNKIRKR